MAAIRITALSMQGEGLGRLGGKIVFVPFTLPDETVEIEIVEDRKNFSRGKLIKVLEPSPDRVAPPCPVFGTCGGCQLQHASLSAQSRIKGNGLREAFRHAFKTEDPPIQPLWDAPRSFYYRHRLRLKIQGLGRQAALGFYRGRSHRVVPVDRCLLANASVNRILAHLYRITADIPFPDESADLEIQCLEADDKGLVLLRVPRRPPASLQRRVTEKLLEIPGIQAVFFVAGPENGLSGPAPFSPDRHGQQVLFPADPPLLDRELALTFFPQVFSQANLAQNRRLITFLLGQPDWGPRVSVLDLFCGQGNFSLPLALKTEKVTGVESLAPAVENARFNQRRNRIDNCVFRQAPARSGLQQLLGQGAKFDLVFMDPPRTGAREILDQVDSLSPRGLYYLSCEPMTLARDLTYLSRKGWALRWTIPLDFFPQTYHLESLSYLSRL